MATYFIFISVLLAYFAEGFGVSELQCQDENHAMNLPFCLMILLFLSSIIIKCANIVLLPHVYQILIA